MIREQMNFDKKYKILEFLNALPYKEYKIAKRKLPIALDVSKRTFERWLYATMDDRFEISADKLAIIAKFLNLESMDELFNYKIKEVTLATLTSLPDSTLINELNLNK
ncbi:hypothetical protein NBT05_12465 [Aquimarina sp. ERC-38]|uniref:hypothetical protein n=1 Tax=Aquimarina sp. ERC-38 TaxID=2949996 RepID=UPI00224855FF|nr:hypothetical protein [Aquimarina sp. ERC-38]UZO79762.1 hypothetical protein NBT05_12465 [Aquimarina sp. ERC-38]